MKQSFGQKGAGGRFLALALALIMLCSVLVPAYAAAADEQGANEPVPAGVTYIFHVGETVQEVKVLSGNALTKPADPTPEEGKVFVCWRLADGQEFTSFGTVVSTTQDETVNLYAHFEDAQPQTDALPTETTESTTTTEESKTEESVTPETTESTTTTEETKTEETKTEEPTTEEPKQEESVTPETPSTTEETTEPQPAEPQPTEPQPAEPQPIEGEPTEGEIIDGEPTEGEEQTLYTTDAQTAEALYERLMAVTSLEEMNSLLENLTEEQNALLEEFNEEQNAELEAKMAELGAYETSTLANPSSITIVRDETQTVQLNKNSYAGISFSGTAVEAGIQATATDYNRSIQISAGDRVLPGTYTLTVSWSERQGRNDITKTDTVTITVTADGKPEDVETKAEVYYLTDPEGNPASNDGTIWSDAIREATTKLYGAEWLDVLDEKGNVTYPKKNIFNPEAYITAMPNKMVPVGDGTYSLPYDDFASVWEDIFNKYQSTWESKYDVELNSVDDFEAIYLIPFKISRNNARNGFTSYPVHIDCTVNVILKGMFDAEFWVTPPYGKQNRVEVAKYFVDSPIEKTAAAPSDTYPETTTTFNGVKYRFVGWKNEEGDLIAWNDETKWPYKPTEQELRDRVVRFEAWYVPEKVTLTVEKEVDGNYVETGGTYQFAYEYVDENQETVSANFELEAGGSTQQIEIPSGTQVTIRETTTGYKTSWSYTYKDGNNKTQVVKSRSGVDGKECTLTMTADTTLTFVNAKNITPDTGILLDSWPYLMALALAAAGAVLCFARRRRDVD